MFAHLRIGPISFDIRIVVGVVPIVGEDSSRMIWFVNCPICRRRFFTTYLLRRFQSDFEPIDYPVSYGHSLGRYGTTIDRRIAWLRIAEVPSEIFQALNIFIKRLFNTYAILDELFSESSYADHYRTQPFSEYTQLYARTKSLPEMVEPYREPNYPEAYLQPFARGV